MLNEQILTASILTLDSDGFIETTQSKADFI